MLQCTILMSSTMLVAVTTKTRTGPHFTSDAMIHVPASIPSDATLRIHAHEELYCCVEHIGDILRRFRLPYFPIRERRHSKALRRCAPSLCAPCYTPQRLLTISLRCCSDACDRTAYSSIAGFFFC